MSSQIQEVKEATDIMAIIGERITLQRSGRNLRAVCPFHSEKSPSFFVTPDLQVFRCFGCGERGDVFTFLEKYEGMTFPESLKYLADRAGIKLEEFQKTADDSQRERLLEILELAKEYYHFLLTKHELGEPGRVYLKDRQLTNETVKVFQLGYALDAWDGLIKYLVGKKKYAILDLEAAGLVILRSNSQKGSTAIRDYYDRFRGRLIFPLHDHRGRVVGFSGRVLEKVVKEAKYINSPETILYHKSKMLFGFSQHFRALREQQSVIVVEGEIDVLSSAQAHVMNVVAIKGSALTREHVELLKRAVDTIILSLDTDSAGIEATKRAITLIQQFEGIRLRVLPATVLEGKDPDEIARNNPKGWREAIKKSVSAYQFLIDAAFNQFDLETGEGKQQVVSALSPVISAIPHAVERAHYVTLIANRLGVSESLLQQDLFRTVNKHFNKSSVNDASTHISSKESEPVTSTEEFVFAMLLHLNDTEILEGAKLVSPDWLTSPALRQLLSSLRVWVGPFSLQSFAKKLPPELAGISSTLYFSVLSEEPTKLKDFRSALSKLKQVQITDQLKQLSEALQALENKEDLSKEEEVKMTELLQEIMALNGKK